MSEEPANGDKDSALTGLDLATTERVLNSSSTVLRIAHLHQLDEALRRKGTPSRDYHKKCTTDFGLISSRRCDRF